MSFHSWLQSLRSALTPRKGQPHHGRRGAIRARAHRPSLEVLEDRVTPSFSPPVAYPVDASAPIALVSADFNNDTHLDLATANGDANAVCVLLGDGAGGFGAASHFGVGASPRSLALADFNNDTHLDLATLNYFSKDVSVLLGNGDGTFRPPVQTATLPWSRAVTAADFNADGNADLVYTADTVGWDSVEVLLGDGQGGFAARHQYQIHTGGAFGLAVADLNADGRPDVVTANLESTVSVLLGNGDGTLSYDFDSSNFATGGGYAYDVAVGDFTSDGIPDLVTTGASDGRLHVLAGRGDGTFAAPILSNTPTGPRLAAADFNGDGRLDVLTVDSDPDSFRIFIGSLFLGWGDGTFDGPADVSIGAASNGAIATGDFNGDGHPDVAVAVSDYFVGNAVMVLLNDGDWPPLQPSVSVRDVTVSEGNTGTANATFTVTLSRASAVDVTVHYATANITAAAGSDYTAASGDVIIPAGQTSRTFTVAVKGDRLSEPTETFAVNLSAATNATIVDSQGVGTILDDEPRISISDVTKAEGRKNQTTLFTFTVTLSAAYDQAVTMSYQTVNGTATTSDSDYIAKTGTLIFAPGETTKTITIEVKGDSKKEANETFYLDLFGNSSNSLFTKNRGLGTILNDD